ncbi:MAG: ABC transporter substrate-binding protein [Deltaproteobacteria bacterium]|nr:ABC transporter substrate-binding protein [Deltaproteobacteria bacterium]
MVPRDTGKALQWLLAAVISGLGTHARAGTELVLAWEAEPRSLDPRYAVDANSQYLEDLLHCALINFDRDGQITPGLAASWQWTTPTTLQLHLREHIRFADGQEVGPKDVVATFQHFLKHDSKAPRRAAFKNLQSVTATSERTVTMTLDSPDASFVANLAVGVLPAAFADGPVITEKTPVGGCGPFQLVSANSQATVLKPNPHWGFGPPPSLSAVVIKIVKDENTRYAKLIAGELDLVQNSISRDKLKVLARERPDLKVYHRPGLSTSYLGFNVRNATLANRLVRRAIAHAIDKEKIIKYVLNGMALNADTLITDSSPFHASGLSVPSYDPVQARLLLDQAGFTQTGEKPRLTLSYKTTTDQTRIVVAKAIAADLRRVGIATKVETLEWGRFKADVDHGRVELWGLSWVGFKDPDIYRFAFATSSIPPNGGNRGWFSLPPLDALLTAGMIETEQAKRQSIYNEVQKIVGEQSPYVFLWHEDVFAVVSNKVSGFELYADGRLSSLAHVQKH